MSELAHDELAEVVELTAKIDTLAARIERRVLGTVHTARTVSSVAALACLIAAATKDR